VRLVALLCIWETATAVAREKPVWLVSNGFHTSLAVRTEDLPFAGEVIGDPRADSVLIGWGAADFYRGKVNLWTILKAVCGADSSLLHVVPVRGAVAARFRHSDVIQLHLSPTRMRGLAGDIDRAFARDRRGQRIFAGRGYYAASRFYAGRERFYFPVTCNFWVARQLRRSGIPIFTPTAIVADGLVRQAAKAGQRQSRRKKPVDAF